VAWFNLVPAVIGVLLATPLVLEFERGTYRLAWTQSITRARWLTARLALIGLGALLAGLALTALMTWWRGPLDDVGSRMSEGFDFEGLVPTTYTLFAAALVLAIGRSAEVRKAAFAVGVGLRRSRPAYAASDVPISPAKSQTAERPSACGQRASRAFRTNQPSSTG
jgi:hypothetical protein